MFMTILIQKMLNVVLWMIILNEQSFNNISRYILKKYFKKNIF